jgi:hypothetical protein
MICYRASAVIVLEKESGLVVSLHLLNVSRISGCGDSILGIHCLGLGLRVVHIRKALVAKERVWLLHNTLCGRSYLAWLVDGLEAGQSEGRY